jgi:hypothetical protein
MFHQHLDANLLAGLMAMQNKTYASQKSEQGRHMFFFCVKATNKNVATLLHNHTHECSSSSVLISLAA